MIPELDLEAWTNYLFVLCAGPTSLDVQARGFGADQDSLLLVKTPVGMDKQYLTVIIEKVAGAQHLHLRAHRSKCIKACLQRRR